MRDLINTLEIDQVLAPQTITSGALTSSAIDTQGCDSLAIGVMVGNITDSLSGSVKVTLKIEHADDDGTGNAGSYAACADADVLHADTLTGGVFAVIDHADKKNKRHAIGYRGDKRFVRVIATPAGLSNGGPIAMIALKGHLAQLPAQND